MEAKDLMVGDWVKFNLYPYLAPYTPVKVSLDAIYKAAKGADVLRFEPIPLSQEILVMNGFEKRPECYINGLSPSYNKYGFALSIYVKNDYFYIYCALISIQIKYVHELQHALRLCGLNDLADNFKIE